MKRVRVYSYNEEIANTWSHGLGILLGVIAGYILFIKALSSNDLWRITSISLYVMGMLSSYVTSTLYHGAINKGKKALLRKFDHAAIFLHIAGTYAPLTLVVLRQEAYWGWGLFFFISVITLAGVILSFTSLSKYTGIKTLCYILMGCSVLVAFKPLIEVLSQKEKMDALYWLITGGVFYIIGAVFYSLAKIKYMHTVFHFFVLAGSICHIFTLAIII